MQRINIQFFVIIVTSFPILVVLFVALFVFLSVVFLCLCLLLSLVYSWRRGQCVISSHSTKD